MRRLAGHPLRGPFSVVLIVVATVLGTAGGVTLYARQQIIAPRAFAGRAADALDHDALRRVVAREIVVQLIDQGSTDLISARPVLESVVDFVVRSDPFRRLFHGAALNANRLLFVRDRGNAAFDASNVGTVVISALRSVAPKVAEKIPPGADAELIALRKRSFATETLRFADQVRVLGLVLPVLALLLYALAIAAAPDRRSAITRAGIAVGIASATLVIALAISRAYVVSHVYGTDEVTNADVRGAIGVIWDSFLGDLSGWAFVVGALALLVGAASASLLRPFSAGDGVARIRARLAPPAAPAGRLLHGLAAIALGVFVVAQPALALEVIAVIAGALLVYYGASVVLSTLNQPARREDARRHRRRTWAIAGGGAAAVAIVIVALTAGGEHARRRAKAVRTCNGYVELCNRRLDQVVFAGTHNSMSAADSPGWLLANQRRTIGRQLHDGIRLFLIDPHYGVRDSQGRVRTDLVREGNKLNRVAKQLSPAATAALERVNGPLGLGKVAGGQARRLALSQPLRAGRHAHGRRAHDGAPFPRAQPGRGGDLPR